MEWTALWLSLRLGVVTALVLLPIGVLAGRLLAYHRFSGRTMVEAGLLLPLVLPPTVLGFYMLEGLGRSSAPGRVIEAVFGTSLVFSFEGLVVASVIVNLPLAIQPMQRAFEAIPRDLREAAACSGLGPLAVIGRIELPLAWPGIVTGLVMSFAHTLGEFGVVLMVGGAIPGETRTASIAIYDRVQAFDSEGAALMSAALLAVSVAAVSLTFLVSGRIGRGRHG